MIAVVEARGGEALERCLAIRTEVFVGEQNVPVEIERDDLDGACTHFLAFESEGEGDPTAAAIGTARLWVEGATGKAQRVAVMKSARGRGVGAALMSALEESALAQGCSMVQLGAQAGAIAFYQAIGYQCYGDPFEEAGIPHRMMRRQL